MQIILLIPAYKPTYRLVELINSIDLEKNFRAIIINNGNTHSYDTIFKKLEKRKYHCLRIFYFYDMNLRTFNANHNFLYFLEYVYSFS